MNVATVCPEPDRLRVLLEGNLGDDERQGLEEHVGHCSSCQIQLEALATGDPSWSSCLRRLDEDTPSPESAYWPAYRRLGREDPSGPTVSDGDRGPETAEFRVLQPASLSFLDPPERDGTLGRLDHFDVLEQIGRGGMGIVLRAQDTCLEREVAIKVLDPELAHNELARQRFCREARAAASIAHEHVVGVHYVDEDGRYELPYLVMPLVRGETIEARLRRQGPLGVTDIVRIGMQVAAGLAAAHAQGLIHRDVKPGNILLERGTDRVKLTDFGLARVAEDARITRSGFVAGTPLYMSPEQARGEDLDPRSDLFSLGAVLYELCTGKTPFEGKTPLVVLQRLTDGSPRPIRELNPEIPEWLAAIVERLLAKEPAQRYESAAELAEELAGHLARMVPYSSLQVPVLPHPQGTRGDSSPAAPLLAPVPDRTSTQGWLLAGLSLFSLLAVATIAGLLLARQSSDPGRAGMVDPPPTPARAVLNANTGPIWSVAFSPDGRTLAMALDDGNVKLWDLDGRRVRATINAHRAPVWGVAFHPSNDRIATASDDGTVRLWAIDTGRELKILKHDNAVRAVAFSPDGRLLVSGSRDGRVRIWDVETGEERAKTAGHAGTVVSVAVSADSTTAASSSGDKTVMLWDLATGRELNTLLGHSGGVYSVALAPDQSIAASGGWDKVVRLWDLANGSPMAELKGHSQDIWCVAFSPDGRLVASVGEDRTVKLWDPKAHREIATFHGHTGTLYNVVFSPDGKVLASGGRDGTVRIWDVPRPPE